MKNPTDRRLPGRRETAVGIAFLLATIAWVVLMTALITAGPVAADPGHNGTDHNGTATPTPTPAPAGDRVVPFAGDPTLTITDWSYTNGEFRIVLEADIPTQLTVTAVPERGQSSGGGTIRQVNLVPGRNVVNVRSASSAVFMTTPTSVSNNRYTFLRAGTSSLIGGPFGADDVRNGIVYALITGAIVLIVLAIRAKLGLDDDAGWVA